MTNVSDTHRLDELDALTERLEAAEEKLERAQKDIKAALWSTLFLAIGLFALGKAFEEVDRTPSTPTWLERQVDDLERRFHLHLHPEEVAHHDH